MQHDKLYNKDHYNSLYSASKYCKEYYFKNDLYGLWKQIVKYVSKLDFKPKIIDIGCGTGQLAHLLWDKGFRDYAGFDYSNVAINIARGFSDQLFFISNAYNPLNYDTQYNTAIIVEVLEHLENDLSVIQMIKPETKIIFSGPTSGKGGEHIRSFKSPSWIKKRYSPYIDIETITGCTKLNKKVVKWYVCSGTRNLHYKGHKK